MTAIIWHLCIVKNNKVRNYCGKGKNYLKIKTSRLFQEMEEGDLLLLSTDIHSHWDVFNHKQYYLGNTLKTKDEL